MITGLAVGMQSVVLPVLFLAAIIYIFLAFGYGDIDITAESIEDGYWVENPLLLDFGFKTGDKILAINVNKIVNYSDLKKGGTLIVNCDSFDKLGFDKAGYVSNPLDTPMFDGYNVIRSHITTQTKEALKDIDLDAKSKARCKNFYALGMTYFMYSREYGVI